MWRAFLRPGDCALIFLALLGTALSFPLLWQGGAGEKLVIRQEGALFLEVDLQTPREIRVPGPLGETRIVVEKGRARVVADPGPRQYCVRQGWLSRAGEIAICAPNRVSLAVTGKNAPYDSLQY
ncbi:MAG: NusG domain II-containing protein [Zoogloeaceae bacterium]|jgi:hypothetical protein|nr:NusG domain II-containing protein [Zoogloeaceae bacterium]